MLKKRSGCIWIGTGVVLALLAGGLGFMAIMRAASTKVAPPRQEVPKVGVVVAARSMAVRDLIQPGDVETRMAPSDIVPESAARDPSEVIGRLTLVPLSTGQMILSSQVISPTIQGGNVAYTMDKGKVAMAFPADDLMTGNRLLSPGDRVDVLFSLEVVATEGTNGSSGQVTFNALQNLEVAAIVQAQDAGAKVNVQVGAAKAPPMAILFALDPQDALVLKYLQDAGGTVTIVLRAPQAKERFSTQPVNLSYLADRYQLRVPISP